MTAFIGNRWGRGFLALLIAAGLHAFAVTPTTFADEDEEVEEETEVEEELEVQDLRERLTEREDETRVEDPWEVEVFGHPLSILGQYEAALETIDRVALGETTNDVGQILFEQEIEVESFYVVSPTLSFFLQFRLAQEEDLDRDTPENVSDTYAERGEMWVYLQEPAGLPLSLEVGRLDFEDDRLWWWDEDLDAVRLIYERETFEVGVAVAREIAPTRSDRSYVEPENEDVLRYIAEISWDWSENHAVEIFGLSQDDRSGTERPGDLVHLDREDETDAQLTWLGFRTGGAIDGEERGIWGYWIDAGYVWGDEDVISLEEGGGEDEDDDEALPPPPRGKGRVEEIDTGKVRGWAFDAGVTCMLPITAEPRITFAYARGSGDGKPDNRTDASYRQTGLHGNEPGFGGVQRFQGYGEVLDPELSNLSIITAGIGCTLLNSSSLDLVYHDYELVEKSDSLRDARIDTELTGADRDIGYGFDLVLGLEEWERFEVELSASAFRAGRAFGRDEGEWVYGTFVAARMAF